MVRSPREIPFAMALAAGLLVLAACGSSSSTSDTVGADVPGDVPADVHSDIASPDVRPDVPVVDIANDPAPMDAADVPAIDVPADVPVDTGPDIDFDAFPPPLTPEQLGFQAVEAPWSGSVIYFNTWGSGDGTDEGKDAIRMIRPNVDPAGSTMGVRARAFSFWTFGIRSDGTIAFASADPLKDTHYPDLANLGNAIQNTYLWGPAADDVPQQISFGRVNDECHVFLPDNKTLLMCRRAKFYGVETPGAEPAIQWFNDPYRLVSLDTQAGTNTWLSPLNPLVNDLSAWPRDDGTLLFTRFFADEMKSSLYSMGADGTPVTLEVEDGNRAIVSQDGKVAWFKKNGSTWRADWNKLGAAVVVLIGDGKVADDLTPSPDGTQIAYTVADQAHNCSDLYVAKVDGTDEIRILDCSDNANLFISGLRWIETPTIE
jgi:hypothetical protein